MQSKSTTRGGKGKQTLTDTAEVMKRGDDNTSGIKTLECFTYKTIYK